MNRYNQLKAELQDIFGLKVIEISQVPMGQLSSLCDIHCDIISESTGLKALDGTLNTVIEGQVMVYNNCGKKHKGFTLEKITNSSNKNFTFALPVQSQDSNVEGIPIKEEFVSFTYFSKQQTNTHPLNKIVYGDTEIHSQGRIQKILKSTLAKPLRFLSRKQKQGGK